MDDRKLMILSLIMGLAGFTGMIISAGTVMPSKGNVSMIDRGMMDREVTLDGILLEVRRSENSETFFLKISDGTGTINAVIFESAANEIRKNGLNLSILVGNRVRITGRVTYYRGAPEIVIDEPSGIKVLQNPA